jgi:hypothetical protein
MADTAAAASTSAAPAPPAVVTRRIHLSGLAPAIPDAALLARFAALQPAGLHRPSAPNAVGAVPAVAWLTLTAPPKDIDRALGALHGSVWKGSKIRCGNAKHDGAKGPLPHKPESEAVRLRREEKEARRLKKASREKGCERPVDEAQVKAGEWVSGAAAARRQTGTDIAAGLAPHAGAASRAPAAHAARPPAAEALDAGAAAAHRCRVAHATHTRSPHHA